MASRNRVTHAPTRWMEARMTERMIFNTFYNFYDFVSGKVSRRRPRAQVGRASDRRLMPEFSRTLLPIAHALVTLALGTCGFTTSSAQSHGLRIQEAGSTSLLANDRLVADHVLEIDWSPDLIRWEPYATVHRRLAPYPAKLESGPGRGAFFGSARDRSTPATIGPTNSISTDRTSSPRPFRVCLPLPNSPSICTTPPVGSTFKTHAFIPFTILSS